uniref:Uncharacterized protein n=1 Tax=Aquila chrysaetos chrysaetos TaxID=223781 RepID=A0A663EMI6_AQUCH
MRFSLMKRGRKNYKRSPILFGSTLTVSADSFASLAKFQYLSIFPDCSLKTIPPGSFIIFIPARKILVHDLGSSNLDHCSFPVFLASVPFSSSPSI